MNARSRLMRTTWIALVWVALSLTAWSPSLCAQTAPLPAGEQVEREPVTRLSPLRGQIVLNGLSRFMPTAGPAARSAERRLGLGACARFVGDSRGLGDV